MARGVLHEEQGVTTVETKQRVGSVDPKVRTTAGVVRGRWENDLAVFRGIPFAAPPVGEARFTAPRPAPGWPGVRDATSFGPPPPQEPSELSPRAGSPDRPAGDDWLTVNIWTPDPDPGGHRSVMVWIYGGGYQLGSADTYDASQIALTGDLVVVTFNYRVGIEGFARIAGAPANRGLLDQVAALRWVQANIAAFGGDPDQVTICGESAGGGSVAALMVMPSAKGLFRRAIAQSVPGPFFSDPLAQDIAAAIAAEIGLRPTVGDLSGVEPWTLPAAGAALAAKMRNNADRWGPVAFESPFAPVVDGEVLPTAPWEGLAAGAGRGVDLIVGHTRDEYRLFMLISGQSGMIDDTEAEFALREFGPGADSKRAYREAFPAASAEELYTLVRSDRLFRMPSLHLAEAQVAGGGLAFAYELTWPVPGDGGVLGACHGLDLPLLFGTFATATGSILLGPAPPPEAEALGIRLRADWTAFAATGDPGWPQYDPQRRLVQVYDVEPAVTAYPEEASRRLWQDYTFAALPLVPAAAHVAAGAASPGAT
jgi:para-nitrobenzyl esterase